MRHQRAVLCTAHGSAGWHPLPSIGSFQGMAISSLCSPLLYLRPEPLHHPLPVLIRNFSIPGNSKRRFDTIIDSTIWFTSELVHLLDILLYCALVVSCQHLRTQTLQYFRDKVGHFLETLQSQFNAPAPSFDIMLPVDPYHHLSVIVAPSVQTCIISRWNRFDNLLSRNEASRRACYFGRLRPGV